MPEDVQFGMREGFVRFDQTQVVPKKWLKRRRVSLTNDALDLLTRWFQFYLTCIADEATRDVIFAYREESLRKIEEAFGKSKA
jgi:hypothetical protein